MIRIKEVSAERVKDRHVAKIVDIDGFEADDTQLTIDEVIDNGLEVHTSHIGDQSIWITERVFNSLDGRLYIQQRLVNVYDVVKPQGFE